MYWRLFSLVLCQAGAASFSWFLAPTGSEWQWAFVLALAGGYLWFALDSLRGLRLLRWLRDGAMADLSIGNGLWGEAYDRIRRMLRASNRLPAGSDCRLKDLWSALQAWSRGEVVRHTTMAPSSGCCGSNSTAASRPSGAVRSDWEPSVCTSSWP